ncbi:MAG: hypothetical protein LKE48_03400 [Solobacterium sp.]|jgi:hypothetical protein|nr:hypothetical protein [Solobacterium sp.]MCH4281551.1 hypothetical protein [Solobacterium sp.]
MNRELIGIMAKFDITQEMLSKQLDISLPTFRRRLSNGFEQADMNIIIEYLQKYDASIDEHIFFAK